jgi:hypothetical protein
MAIPSQNTKLFWSNSTVRSTLAACLVGDVISFSGPTGSAGVIDITTLLSTAKEKMLGLPDEGQITMELILRTSDTAQIALRADRRTRTKRKATIQMVDDTTTIIDAKGYVSGFSITGAVDEAIKGSVTLELTGLTTWTTA